MESNFMKMAIDNGFTPYPKDFRPYDNWFGVSKMHPDAMLTKGEKKITLSLQGLATPFPYNHANRGEILAALSARSVKYICFQDGEKVVYENYFGELPTTELIEQFINEKTPN